MGKIAFIYHPDFKRHDTGGFHPERPGRAETVFTHIRKSALRGRMEFREPAPAEARWIEKNHSRDYMQFVEETCAGGRTVLDHGDTRVCPVSFRIALLAAGGAMAALDAVMRDGFRRAFSCARPPGHHARPAEAMGFCLFNNVAIAARYGREQYALERILIVDWDVHHGNGTQESFYSDPNVLFFSAHQYPYYPGSGSPKERGEGPGKGFTLNAPLPAGAGIADYRIAFDEVLAPAAEAFKPQLILLSAGFDAHRDDPLAGINLGKEDFGELTERVTALADRHCGGRLVSILEGGYNLEALAQSVEKHLSVLLKSRA